MWFKFCLQVKIKSTRKKINLFLLCEVLISVIAISLFKANFVTSIVLLLVCQVALILASVFKNKLNMADILYFVAVFLPVLLTVLLAPIFGFQNIFVKLLVCLYVLASSFAFAKSLSNFAYKKDSFNLFLLLSSIAFILFNIFVLLICFSNVSFKFESVLKALFFISQILVVWCSYIKFGESSKPRFFEKLKLNIKGVLFSTFSAFIICYTIISSLLCFNVASAKIFKDEFYNMVKDSLNIPVIEISTQYNELPKNKEDYVNCSFSISNCEDDQHNFSVNMASSFDNEDDGVDSVGIRLRGNSTKDAKKRPYRIKFEEKKSVMGLTKNKSWVLLADYYDQSYMRNYTAFAIADNFDNLNFSATPYHVALIINNEFKGLYLLCEQMDENKGRANVKEDFDVSVDTEFPFLVEMDEQAHKEGITGVDNFYVNYAKPTEIKYPESDERGKTQTEDKVYDYIYEYINAVFKIINTGEKVAVSFRQNPVGLEDLVDIDSAVDYYLINEIMLNTDSTSKSIYMHKTKSGKLHFGPIWDFDFSMSTVFEVPYSKSHIEDVTNLHIAKQSTIFKKLMQTEEFYNKIALRFNNLKANINNTLNTLKDYKNKIDNIALIDAQMWHGLTGEFQFDMQYDYVRLFLSERMQFLSDAFARTHTEFLQLI